MEQKWGKMNGGNKGRLIGFVILFSYPVPSERIDFWYENLGQYYLTESIALM